MAVQEYNLPVFVRGDSYAIPVNFKRDGNPEDFTGWRLTFTVKNHALQADSEASIQKTYTVSGSSQTISLAPADTLDLPVVNYVYDIQLVSPDQTTVHTIVNGKLTLKAAVTHTTGEGS